MESRPSTRLADLRPAGNGHRFFTLQSAEATPKAWQFSLVVPVAWTPVEPGNSLVGRFHQILKCVPDNGQDAELVIAAVRLPREVDAMDWLAISWEQSGGEILERWPAGTGHPTCGLRTPPGGIPPDADMSVPMPAEVFVRHVSGSRCNVWRSAIVKDAGRLFRVEARAAESIYMLFAKDFFFSLASFRLLHPEGISTAEPLLVSVHQAPMPFRFARLASWDISPAVVERDQCVLHLATRHDDSEVGRMAVEIRNPLPGLTAQRRAQNYAKNLQEQGVHLGGGPVVPIRPPMGFQAAAIFTPSARRDGHEFDAPVLLLQHAEALVALSLFGPTRQESPEWWAINKRAFEIVRDSLVIGNTEGPP